MALDPTRTPTQAIPGPRCAVCLTLQTMDDTDRDVLQTWLGNAHLRSVELSQWLEDDAGIRIGQQSIQRHRRGACSGGRRVAV